MSLLLALLLGGAALAPTPAPPPAAGHWTADWEDQLCSLVRETGGPASKTLMVRSVPGTEQAELWWRDPDWKGPKLAAYVHAKVVLKPSGTSDEGLAFGGNILGKPGFVIEGLGGPFLRALGESQAIEVLADGRTLVDLPLPAADKAVAALHACEDDSLRRWGLDPAGDPIDPYAGEAGGECRVLDQRRRLSGRCASGERVGNGAGAPENWDGRASQRLSGRGEQRQ